MNSETNKQKRKAYVEKITNRIGLGKTVIYIDESNANLFLRRSQGHARKGVRCMPKSPTAKGKNIHIIGSISNKDLCTGSAEGAVTGKKTVEYGCVKCFALSLSPSLMLLLCAPVHSGLETIAEEDEFNGVEILRSSPYSAPLNPIEECWSVMKAAMKWSLAENFRTMMDTPTGITQTEYRMQYWSGYTQHYTHALSKNMQPCTKTFSWCYAVKGLEYGWQWSLKGFSVILVYVNP